ncbi:MAG: SH3 domain-containing protein, partial [Gemmatimonadales bacterium]
MRTITVLFVGIGLLGCVTDHRRIAVEEFVEFGLASPFTVVDVEGVTPYLGLEEQWREDFNRLFQYLTHGAPVDSLAPLYAWWKQVLLRNATLSRVENVTYARAGDTLVAVIAVQRPEPEHFRRTVLDHLLRLTAEELAHRLALAKTELQVPDTVTLRVVDGPHIVGFSAWLLARDSVRPEAPTLATDVPAAGVLPSGDTTMASPGDSILQLWVRVNSNVREGPGLDHPVTGLPRTGRQVVVDSLAGRWYHLKELETKIGGWVAGSLLTPESTAVTVGRKEDS